jgi:large-conductance mechanosensitive channel
MNTIKNELSEYLYFLKYNNILGLAIGLILASSALELSNSLINYIIMPTLHPILKKNKNYIIKIGSIIINLEMVISSFFKLLILTIIIYILFRYGVKFKLSTSIATLSSSIDTPKPKILPD